MTSSLRRVTVKVFFYYLITVGGLLWLLLAAPEARDYLPVGGIDSLNQGSIYNLGSDSVDAFQAETTSFRALTLLSALLGTLIFTLPLSWVYKETRVNSAQHESILETIFLLPITVASVVMVVQNSIALAFSLAGIVAAVRFRSNLKMPADAVFVFAALAIGLASGVSEIGIAGVGSMVFSFTALTLRYFSLGGVSGAVSNKRQDL